MAVKLPQYHPPNIVHYDDQKQISTNQPLLSIFGLIVAKENVTQKKK